MNEDQTLFYKQEKLRFDELLTHLNWTEDCLLNEQQTFLQCPIDQGHRFPVGSKHLQTCQLAKEGFSKDYFKEQKEYEQEKQLLHQAAISFPPSILSTILHRPVAITNDIPLNVEQTTVLFTPEERSSIAEAVHNEALRLGIVCSTPSSSIEKHPVRSHDSNTPQKLHQLAELRDQKRRRVKYVTRTNTKSFYDTARQMIDSGMELIEQIHADQIQTAKHRSSSKRKHHSRHKHHHRHSKKRRHS